MVECSQPPYFRTRQKNGAKQARSGREARGDDVGLGFASEAGKKNGEAVDIFGRQWTS